MAKTALILLAAGTGSRMRGADKLLQEVDGQPLLRVMAKRGLAAGLDVRVPLPALDHPRAAALAGLGVTMLSVPEAAELGMSASLRAALLGLDAPAALVLPADMPEITAEDLRAVATAPGDIVRASAADGRPGHPVRFPARLYPALQRITGDQGARQILAGHRDAITHIALPGQHALTDLDTPEAWAAWRAGQATH